MPVFGGGGTANTPAIEPWRAGADVTDAEEPRTVQ